MMDTCPEFPELYYLATGTFLGACIGIILAAIVIGSVIHHKDVEIVELRCKAAFLCNLLCMSDNLFPHRQQIEEPHVE